MELLKAIAAEEKRLATAFPSIPISYENEEFNPPSTTYMMVQSIPQEPVDPVFGSKYRRERLSFQVFIVGEINKGTGEVLTIAGQVRDLFERGVTIDVDNLRIQHFSSPKISGAMTMNNRVVVPVIIPVTVEVYD